MYNTVFFIANKPLSKEFEVAENVKDVAMDGIADYFTDSQPIPSSFVGTEVLKDGYFRLTEEDIENHFKDRFELCKKLFEQASLSDFCEGIKDGIMPVELIIDETYETYIVCDYNPDDLSECCSMTLDSFLRKAYQEIRSNEEKIRYIVGCCGYHC